MAQQTVNTTDTVEQMRGKVNANFTEVYSLGLPAYYTDTGGDGSYVITTDIAYSALTAGMAFALEPTTGNTGACTLAVDSTGAIAIKVIDASGVRDPLTGEIPAGGLIWVQYNGTYWVLLNPAKALSPILTYQLSATGSPVTNGQLLLLSGLNNISKIITSAAAIKVTIHGVCYNETDGVLHFGPQSSTLLSLPDQSEVGLDVYIDGSEWRLRLLISGVASDLVSGRVEPGQDITEIVGFIQLY